MPINSKIKGAKGEREFARVCRDHGYDECRRGQQYNGIEGEDIVGLPHIHLEIKRVEKLSIHSAMDQSIRDAEGKIPVVAHRRNNTKWLITLTAEDFFKIYKEFELNITEEENETHNCKEQIKGSEV